MELLFTLATLIIFLNVGDTALVQGTDASALTPSLYYFSIYEDAGVNNTLGTIYTTSNFDLTVNYTILDSFFLISASGVIIMNGPIDYETPSHRLLTAFISGTNTGSFTLCLQDSNDNAPIVSSPSYLTINTTESQLASMNIIWKLYSTDADSNENGIVTFSLAASGGGGGGSSNNNNKFSIYSDGILINTSPLSSNNKTFVVEIQVTDGGSPSLTSQFTFMLTVNRIRELVLEQDRYVVVVDESVSIGTLIDALPPSTNPELALFPVPVNFIFNTSTGKLAVINALDYETRSSFTFSVVKASDTNIILAELVIFINNVVDMIPLFVSEIFEILPALSIAGNVVYCPSDIYSEEDAVITFQLFSSDDLFTVDSTTGIISLTRSIVYDIPSTYIVTLQLTDRRLSNNETIKFYTSPSDAPLPSQPTLLFAMDDNSSSSDRVFWQQPQGIYPLQVFPLGLSYTLTYQPLNNLSDVHTVYTNYTSVGLYLDTGSIYFIRVAAALTESKYGPYAVITYAKGNENTMATLINSTSISVSWDELEYCFSDYHIQYEISYYEVLFYNETRTITINITDILDPLFNTTSCIPQFVLLINLTPSVTYCISLRVTIDELGVNSALIAEICKDTTEDYISISPDHPLCTGESVSITCFIYPNQHMNASSDSVYFSFNNSTPLSNEINSISRTNNAIDLTNLIYQIYNSTHYVSPIFGQIDIQNFTEELSTVEFSCHLKTRNESFTDRLLTTKLEKVVAPIKPNCSHSVTYFDSNSCYFNIEIYWSPISSGGSNVSYFLKENAAILSNSNLLSYSFNLSTKAVPFTNHSITLSAQNCAGESDNSICFARLFPGFIIRSDSFFLAFEESSGSLTLIWNLYKFPLDAVDVVIFVAYSLEINFEYLSCNESIDYDYIYEEVNTNISQYSQNSSYALNLISPPQQLSYIYLQATIKIIELCGETETVGVPHTNYYEYYYDEPIILCEGNIVTLDPFTCYATHDIQWQEEEEEESRFLLYFNQQSIQVEIPGGIDFRRIEPNITYNYTLKYNTTHSCISNPEQFCFSSIIAGYKFDPDAFSIVYSPETESLTIYWVTYDSECDIFYLLSTESFIQGYVQVATFPPAQVIALKLQVYILFDFKFVNNDWENSTIDQDVIFFSNVTAQTFSSPHSFNELEALNIFVSFQIIEQCGFRLNNNYFTLTYNYTIDSCKEGDTSCFKDSDEDGYPDTGIFCPNLDTFCKDNCPTIYNPSQSDCNGDGIGDECDDTCEPETDQTFSYNWTCTEGGNTQYMPCLQVGGNANRLCKEDGNWSDLIDTSNCFSPEYEVFRGNISIDNLENFANVVSMKAPETAGDVGVIVDVLNTTIEATLNVSSTEREKIVSNTLKVIDVITDDSSQKLLVQSQSTTNVAQKVINIMEQQASSLALNQPTNLRMNRTKNVFIEIQTINLTQSEGLVINADNIQGEKEGQATPSVIVPIPKNIDPQKSLSVSVVVMKNIGKLITSFADAITVGTGGLKLSAFSNFEIVSPVISVQLFSGNELVTGDTLVELSIPLSLSGIDLIQNYIKPTCLALTNTTSSNPEWYDGGIQNVSNNDINSDDIVRCLPSHATPFVVLVGVGNLKSQSVVLNILSYVGCSLSVICLMISLVIYLVFGRALLRKIYHFVHFQLAFSLCLLYLAFLFGIEPAYANVWLYIPCKLVTVLVQYLLLVVFLWMLMEGLVVLIMIMFPFHQFGWKHFVIFSIISWAIPLLYVVPFIPFFHEYYISPPLGNSSIQSLTNVAKFCFIHNDETLNLILSVTIPLALIIILNVVFLIAVIARCLILILKQRSLNKFQRAQKTSMRLLRLLIVMFPVLGFGWIFGLLAIYFNTTVFAWIFTILCAFQGFFFLFFVLLIRRDIQQSIVSALNLKATFLTMQSKISSQFSKPVSTKESQFVTKQTLIFYHPRYTGEPDLDSPPSIVDIIESKDDMKTLSKLFLAKESGLFPPTVELEDMLMFHEDRHWPWVDLDVKNKELDIDPEQNEYLFDRIAKDLDAIAIQITEVDPM